MVQEQGRTRPGNRPAFRKKSPAFRKECPAIRNGSPSTRNIQGYPWGVKDMEPTVERDGIQEGWKKRRGQDRPILSLGGKKKMEKATKKKERRKVN